MIDIVKRHAVPAALIVAGIGWVVFDVVFASARAPATPDVAPTDTAEPLTGSTSTGEPLRDAPVDDTRSRRRSAGADTPLAVGALGLVAGALLGAVLPLTQRDRAWQRLSQDWLGDQAEALGRDALEIAEAAGRAAVAVVRQEIAAASRPQAGADDDAPSGDGKHSRNGARPRARRH